MRRLLMLLSALCLVMGTAACSDDDGDGKGDDDKKSPAAHGVDPKKDRNMVAKIEQCDAEVSTTGAFEGDWSGVATVRTGGRNPEEPGPLAVYTLENKKNTVGLYSPGPDFKGSVSLSIGPASYSSDPADVESLDIDERGRHADVDIRLTSVGGDAIDLKAEFTCGKAKP